MTSPETSLLDDIYGAVANPGGWPAMLTRVADHLGAIGGLATQINLSGRQASLVVGRLSNERGVLFKERHARNLWSTAMASVPFGRALVIGSLVDNRSLRRTAFHADVIAPQGIVDMLSSSHAGFRTQDGVGGFSFALDARGAEHAAEGARRMQRLIPHLGRALDATIALAPLIDGSRHLQRVLQLMPNAALLLDRRGRVRYANEAAEQLFRDGDGLTLDRERRLQLGDTASNEAAAFACALTQALDVASGSGIAMGGPVRVTRLSGKGPLLMVPVPLPPPVFELWELSEAARVLLLIVDPDARPREFGSILQTVYGLTAAEARVAALIASGLSGPQTAAALGVSLPTVKTHLARCFEKIGVHSQAGLARLFASMPGDSNGSLWPTDPQ